MTKPDLTKMSYHEYEELRASGMMWEFYPEATGVYSVDCKKAIEEKERENNNKKKTVI